MSHDIEASAEGAKLFEAGHRFVVEFRLCGRLGKVLAVVGSLSNDGIRILFLNNYLLII